jgi:hypothetical protein
MTEVSMSTDVLVTQHTVVVVASCAMAAQITLALLTMVLYRECELPAA